MIRKTSIWDASHEASPYPSAIRQLVQERKSQGDERILSLLLKKQTKDHPRVLDHLQMTQKLLDFMEPARAVNHPPLKWQA